MQYRAILVCSWKRRNIAEIDLSAVCDCRSLWYVSILLADGLQACGRGLAVVAAAHPHHDTCDRYKGSGDFPAVGNAAGFRNLRGEGAWFCHGGGGGVVSDALFACVCEHVDLYIYFSYGCVGESDCEVGRDERIRRLVRSVYPRPARSDAGCVLFGSVSLSGRLL